LAALLSFHLEATNAPSAVAISVRPCLTIVWPWALSKHVHPDSHLVTDTTSRYKFAPVAKHEAVDHSKFEWTRGVVHTNTLESFFSVLKRGLVGVYQHVDVKHLDRYLAEFDFRQNTRAKLGINDEQRADLALRGAARKAGADETDRGAEKAFKAVVKPRVRKPDGRSP
jgi:hypothetical protein